MASKRSFCSWALRVGAAAVVLAAGAQMAAWAESIVESARDVPVAYDVDVVVVGGTTGAVAAAVEAAEQGASVFLAAPRPYLGEDVTGTLRLWLEDGEQPQSVLEKQLFAVPNTPQHFPGRLKFSYEADQPTNNIHPDTKTPSRLGDGQLAGSGDPVGTVRQGRDDHRRSGRDRPRQGSCICWCSNGPTNSSFRMSSCGHLPTASCGAIWEPSRTRTTPSIRKTRRLILP